MREAGLGGLRITCIALDAWFHILLYGSNERTKYHFCLKLQRESLTKYIQEAGETSIEIYQQRRKRYGTLPIEVSKSSFQRDKY